MRKDILLPGAALAGGLLGFGLRRWQIASAYVTYDQLFLHGAPATTALLAALALVLAVLLVLNRGGSRPGDLIPAFRCPLPGFMAVMAGSGFVLMGGGLLALLSGAEALSMWRLYPGSVQLAYPLTLLAAGLLALPGGLGLLLLGRCCYRDRLDRTVGLLASLPAFAGLMWVLNLHLANGVNPILMSYGPLMAAAILLTLAHYFAVSFLYDRCRPRAAVFCGCAGTVLALTSLGGVPGLRLPDVLLLVSLSASALAMSWSLLRNSCGPAWNTEFRRMPQGADEEDEDETGDETETHEI